ncbi:MAG: hypothetical protein ABI178_00760 [Rhodanobacter sp.]
MSAAVARATRTMHPNSRRTRKQKAFVGPWQGGARVGALAATHTICVTAPNRDIAVRLLREAVPRLPSD